MISLTPKANMIINLAGTVIADGMPKSQKLLLSTAFGLICGRPVIENENDTIAIQTHLNVMKTVRKDSVNEAGVSKDDVYLLLQDVTVLTATDKTFHFDAMTVFLDQVISATVGEVHS